MELDPRNLIHEDEPLLILATKTSGTGSANIDHVTYIMNDITDCLSEISNSVLPIAFSQPSGLENVVDKPNKRSSSNVVDICMIYAGSRSRVEI